MKNFYRDGGLVLSIMALVVAILCLSGYIYTVSPQVFWLIAPFVVLAAGFAVGKLIQVTRKTFQYFARIDEEIDKTDRVSLYSFPLGVAIMDTQRKLVWFNENFEKEFPEESVYGTPIDKITSESLDKLINPDGVEIMYKKKHYRIYASVPKEEDAQDIYLIYFRDITRLKTLEIEKRLTHPVVMIIMIDSFDELFGNNTESEKAHVTVQIDKLLEDFMSGTTGILRKDGRDKFWAVLEQQHVEQMIEGKVKILDMAREIAVTDRINVTLSIGIGTTGATISESEQFAKQALDMAQGRGGDQAAIKTNNGFEFYGGVSKGVERKNKVKTRIIANSLIELVESCDSVYIMGHRFSDLDSIGSAVGLACGIRNLGKPAHVVIDKLASLGKQLIERVSGGETEKDARLFISPQQARTEMSENSLLIIVDTHNPLMVEDGQLYSSAQKVVVIDHHRKMVNHIDNALIFHHEPYASSASEMVTEILQYFGAAGKITALQAEALLAGIMLDTKNFAIKTGVRTFEAAAFLRKLGADTINVKELFSNSIENYKQKVNLVASAEIYRKCAVASTDIISADMRTIAPQAADELLGITGVDASFVMYTNETENGKEVYISARSLGALNVQLIMEYLGGGGHQTMAGVQLKNTIDEAKHLLIEAIDKFYDSLNKKD
ncbi:MAG: DHH family phosphoesterase [Ruminiclostridium sp.]